MGTRVGLTSTGDALIRMEEACHRLDLSAVRLPCIRVSPASQTTLESFRMMAETADWIVVTSPRAVTTVWGEVAMPRIPVAVVGPETARTVEMAGGEVSIIGDGGGEELLKKLAGVMRGALVAYPHPAEPAIDLVAALEEAGAVVRHAVVYTTTPVAPPSRPVEAVVFGSPSAVAGWAMTRSFADLVVAASGPTTAAALSRHGCTDVLVPARPGSVNALEALAIRLKEEVHS